MVQEHNTPSKSLNFTYVTDLSKNGDNEYERTFTSKTDRDVLIRVKLLPNGILVTELKHDKKKSEIFIGSDEIIACELESRTQKRKDMCVGICDDTTSSAESDMGVDLLVHGYMMKSKKVMKTKKQRAYREKILIRLPFDSNKNMKDNLKEAKMWERAIIITHVKMSQRRPVNFLVFINPKSGSGQAKTIFESTIASVLSSAGVTHSVKITERPQFAHDFVRDNDLSPWNSILICGGDGLLFEVINGISARPDSNKILEELMFGVIPCGSGNGLAATIQRNYGVPDDNELILNATLAAVSGHCSPMDLVHIETANTSYHSFLSLTWGFMADVDIRSEAIKSIVGNARFTIWALKNLLFLTSYRATLYYLPVTDDDIEYSPDLVPALECPLEHENTPWVTVDDSFILITAAFQSHLSPDVHFAPDSSLDDGIIWLVYVRAGISRYRMFNFLIGLETATHIPKEENEFIKVVKCKAFRIVPNAADKTVIAVDGEELEFGSIQGKLIPKAAKVLVPNQSTQLEEK